MSTPSYGDSHPRPLIVAATNCTTAKLAGFYSSPLVEKLKQYDLALPKKTGAFSISKPSMDRSTSLTPSWLPRRFLLYFSL